MAVRLAAILIAVTGMLVQGACGGDDDESAPGATTATTAAPSPGGDDPAAVFQQFQTALADGDAATACGLLAPSAVKQTEEASIGGTCEKWVGEVSGVYDDASKEKVRNTKVSDTKISGNTATLKYTSPILNIPLEVELEKTGDTWKISKLSEAV